MSGHGQRQVTFPHGVRRATAPAVARRLAGVRSDLRAALRRAVRLRRTACRLDSSPRRSRPRRSRRRSTAGEPSTSTATTRRRGCSASPRTCSGGTGAPSGGGWPPTPGRPSGARRTRTRSRGSTSSPRSTALSGDEREALFLFAVADLSYEEIAVALAVPVGTVRSRLARARERVRRMVADGPLTRPSSSDPKEFVQCLTSISSANLFPDRGADDGARHRVRPRPSPHAAPPSPSAPAPPARACRRHVRGRRCGRSRSSRPARRHERHGLGVGRPGAPPSGPCGPERSGSSRRWHPVSTCTRSPSTPT